MADIQVTNETKESAIRAIADSLTAGGSKADSSYFEEDARRVLKGLAEWLEHQWDRENSCVIRIDHALDFADLLKALSDPISNSDFDG